MKKFKPLPIIMPIIRQFIPNIIANSIVGVQPMTGPSGSIFNMRMRFKNQKLHVSRHAEYKNGIHAVVSYSEGDPDEIPWRVSITEETALFINDWCKETQCGIRTEFMVWRFNTEQEFLMFVLKWDGVEL